MVTRLTFQKHSTTFPQPKCFENVLEPEFVSGAVLRQLWSLARSLILNPYRVNGKASWADQEWMWTDRLWHKTARLLIRARLHRHLHSPLRQSIQSKRGYEELSESLPWNHSQSEWPQSCTLHTSWQFLTVTQDVITSPPSFSLSLLFLGAVTVGAFATMPQGCVFYIHIIPFKEPRVIVFVQSELSSEGDYWEHCLGPYDDGGPQRSSMVYRLLTGPWGEGGGPLLHGKKSDVWQCSIPVDPFDSM